MSRFIHSPGTSGRSIIGCDLVVCPTVLPPVEFVLTASADYFRVRLFCRQQDQWPCHTSRRRYSEALPGDRVLRGRRRVISVSVDAAAPARRRRLLPLAVPGAAPTTGVAGVKLGCQEVMAVGAQL